MARMGQDTLAKAIIVDKPEDRILQGRSRKSCFSWKSEQAAA
jgi:hypothetical protein